MINLLRKSEILKQLNFSKSTLHNKINDSLFPSPCSFGARAVFWPCYEIDAMSKAYIAGFSPEQIKALVTSMLESRKSLFSFDESLGIPIIDIHDEDEHECSTSLTDHDHKEG